MHHLELVGFKWWQSIIRLIIHIADYHAHSSLRLKNNSVPIVEKVRLLSKNFAKRKKEKHVVPWDTFKCHWSVSNEFWEYIRDFTRVSFGNTFMISWLGNTFMISWMYFPICVKTFFIYNYIFFPLYNLCS